MKEYKILFIGDIFGMPGRQVVTTVLPQLIEEFNPLFVIANGENAASGAGITPKIAELLFSYGIDGITLGNHTYDNKEIISYLDSSQRIIRPANFKKNCPGQGVICIEKNSIKLAIINLSGRTFMDPCDDPFECIDEILKSIHTNHILVDFHAEATSEKNALGWYLDGRVTAVLGTHTHVTTADEVIFPQGTAYQTDVGMSGPIHSVVGVQKEIAIRRFLLGMKVKFEVSSTPGKLAATLVTVNSENGKAIGIQRISREA